MPVEVDIWWNEEPRVVVSVWSSNLYPAEQLATLVQQLEPADAMDGGNTADRRRPPVTLQIAQSPDSYFTVTHLREGCSI